MQSTFVVHGTLSPTTSATAIMGQSRAFTLRVELSQARGVSVRTPCAFRLTLPPPNASSPLWKVVQVNDDIDRMRHSATRSLLERRDVIVVASVCLVPS